MDKMITDAIVALAENHHAGAAEIADQAADIFLQYSQDTNPSGEEHLRRDLLQIGWACIRAHPTMAPLVNLVNAVLWSTETRSLAKGQNPNQQEMLNEVVNAATTFKYRSQVHEAAIAELVLPLIPEQAQVLTLGRSSTVKAALRHAQHAGRRFNVVCAEGRPGYEGHLMAAELSEYGIPVELVVDALAVFFVSQVQLVLVGADHLRNDDLVNKVGTYGVALAAREHGVPIYALCGSEKFLPPGYNPPPRDVWPAEQIWNNPPPGVVVQNIYFDHTPLSQITGIVTEKGVLPTVGIEAWMAAIKLHPALHNRMA
jgi:translation initiation factor 2B subunit (eIF-2B alpha/beta/delta family)